MEFVQLNFQLLTRIG